MGKAGALGAVVGGLTGGLPGLAIGALGGSLLSNMGKTPESPALPALSAPAVMPIPDDQAALDAKKRAIATAQNRSGRASTVLSQPGGDSDTLG